MLLDTYVKVTLLLSGLPSTLDRRMQAKKAEDGGLATLEWVALAIVAVTIAAGAAVAITAAVDRKIAQIP